MIPIATIRQNPEHVVERLKVKHFDASGLVEQILDIDKRRRENQVALDALRAENNQLSKEIGGLMQQGKKDEATALRAKVSSGKEHLQMLENELNNLEQNQVDLLYLLPNLPCHNVPAGKTPADNPVLRSGGKIPEGEQLKPHWDLCADFDIIDFELGNKITGAGFPVYKGKGARLQRALQNFFLDYNTEAGYIEIQPPVIINEASGYGTGQLPDKEGQMYFIGEDNLYLIPTAEVPLTNLYRDVILEEKDFPICMTGYTPCFRREAGSYGKDVRGLNRLHQFDKVEIVRIEHPDRSYDALDGMLNHVEGLLQKLELPYRILTLCGGDMSFTSALTYDFEVFAAGQQKWLEVSSVSNFEDYQANRLKLRYRSESGKNILAHTLNGSSLAFPRILASLLENNFDGEKVKIPTALVPYCGFEFI